jgi:cysteine desulfurase/selenocysteine lyase
VSSAQQPLPGGAETRTAGELDVKRLREEFPILRQKVHGQPLVYLDNAASMQKPQSVIDAVNRFYTSEYSNVHRGVHELSARATAEFEGARIKLQRFIHAAESREIIFTGGTTDSINLVAHSLGSRITTGDEIVLTRMEHHSNIVPWQLLCERSGARIRVAPINDRGELILDEFEKLLGPRTRIVSVAHTSNALGTRNPVARITEMAHAHGAVVLLDAAQAMAHETIDVQALDCDLFAFSGHKMLGATGSGVLYGKAELLESLPPFKGGGEMILSVSFEETTFKGPPARFEAGTPDIAGAIGLGAAVDYLDRVGLAPIRTYENELLAYATGQLQAIDKLRLIGTAEDKGPILAFVVEGIHPHDLGTALDAAGIAVRAGHHCAQPVMEFFGVPATVRASLAFYNTNSEIDALAEGIRKAIEVLG